MKKHSQKTVTPKFYRKKAADGRNLYESKALIERARKVIPRMAQTLSKAPDQFVGGISPYAIKQGLGGRVWDVDGNEYIDLTSSLGALVLGHKHPVVEQAVAEQRKNGTIFGLPGDLEVELAELIREHIPFAQMSRFGLNGSDVTAAAIRVARACTGRDHVAKCGYHGWQDWTIATNEMRNKGVPGAVKKLTHEFAFNDIKSLENIFAEYPNKIAAVILEPVNNTMPAKGFLSAIKKTAHKNGALLIFDELVTGFRIALGGAAEYFGVEPDLATYGKAISNGEPLSVLAGKKEYMEELNDVFFSFTYGGYLTSVAAALAVIRFLKKEGVCKKLWQIGNQLFNGYQGLITKYQLPVTLEGFAAHPIVSFKHSGVDNLPLKTLYLQETIKAGIFTNCKNFVNYSHSTKDIKIVLEKTESVFEIMASAIKENKIADLLEGPVVRARYRS